MKSRFQAKDIQKMLGIQKHRYEYLSSKIGIRPDIEQVEGRGHSHLYSFRNALQFGLADIGNGLGLSPANIRRMLVWIDEHEKQVEGGIGIFNPKVSMTPLLLHYVDCGDHQNFWLDYDLPDNLPVNDDQFNEQVEQVKEARQRMQGELDMAFGHVTVNVALIKKIILRNAAE